MTAFCVPKSYARGGCGDEHGIYMRRATALISFEGPMSQEVAKKREPKLADELREQGYNVYGGH